MSEIDGNEAGLPFWFRRWIQSALALIEKKPARAWRFPDHFDNSGGFIAEKYRDNFYSYHGVKLPYKGRAQPIPVEARTHICVHQTAIEFGTAGYRRRFWKRQITSGAIPEDVVRLYDPGDNNVESIAERITLHERFWKVPYHYVALVNGDILYNNPIDRYTYHGNGANDHAIGVACEANLPGLQRNYRKGKHTRTGGYFIDTNRQTIRLAVEESRDLGAPIEFITAHRCYSSGRRADPGEFYWKNIVIPVAKELDLKIQYSYTERNGYPIPKQWDSRAWAQY